MAGIIEPINGQDKDQKAEIYLNNNQAERVQIQETEIDLLNIFTYMKLSRSVFVWLIIAFVTLGVFLPYTYGLYSTHTPSVYAVISYEYGAAGDMKTPDGRTLDVTLLSSSNIIANAIKKSRLPQQINPVDVANNIHIKHVLTGESKQRKEILEKVGSEKATTTSPLEYIADMQAAASYSYRNRYIIQLDNKYGETYLSGEEMEELLNNIIAEYKSYFYANYGSFRLPDNTIKDIDIEELDYIEWLDNMTDVLNSLSAYCTAMNKTGFATYRSVEKGFTFNDINRLITLTKETRIDYLYSFVYYNYLAKNSDNVVTRYSYTLRNLERDLSVLNENITTGANIIENYRINNILISRQGNGEDGGNSIKAKSVTDYYNNLILEQAERYDEKAALLVRMNAIRDKIDGFSNKAGYASRAAIAEEEIRDINELCLRIYNLVEGLSNEIVNSESFSGAYITSIDASYTGGFLSENLKNMMMGAAIGALAAFAAWVLYGVVKELQNGSGKAGMNDRG